ncbi:putative sister chromatid cohesion protein [Eremomyces bilateralis CBS 781.70]|uniref:DNA polymerase eta n=1 Tax=Eremomyces bilateralis CBS 781.70 TaxID=1392243 RepID=A0A6G1GF89_9PEZI|nr:putative sister chromatid cohesion protein [Eremomyces bilateralis CBS 781.70]KAF1816747.1 putative sister chromatid cohesion protein [Eremomyces bilateralis CBS 781.70]
MSSSQPFVSSLPTCPNSRFTFRHLQQLSQYSTTTPLRVIALVDLDAFYAQCEIVRLGLPPTTPLGVQQWQALIAINYPAREFGLSRHVTPQEAREKCPEVVLPHVPTWKEGDDRWRYREDDDRDIATHKVSLDPYRLESRKIVQVIKETLPSHLQRVEKASIDEVFLDLSAHIHSILLERFPELQGPPDDPAELLPEPPTSAIDWDADKLINLDDDEEQDHDWDDIAMAIGAEIVRGLRDAVRTQLKYTCSGGIARNKMLAKLGAGHKKPNSQTVIRNRAISQFLSPLKFTKIRNLGGKLGDQLVSHFHTDSITELLSTSLGGLKRRLDDDTAAWVYSTLRGIDHSEVNPRTRIKSMLSAKSFQPTINSWDAAVKWLRIFAADIFLRCMEEGVLENRRRPKTLALHFRQGNTTRSRQAPISSAKKAMTEDGLLNAGKGLLAQVVSEGRAWPCRHLSLSVGGFEDCVEENKGIGNFLLRGEEARMMNEEVLQRDKRWEEEGDEGYNVTAIASVGTKSAKRKRPHGDTGALHKFLRPTSELFRPDLGSRSHAVHTNMSASIEMSGSHPKTSALPPSIGSRAENSGSPCPRCSTAISPSSKDEHADWHFASDLSTQLAAESPTRNRPPDIISERSRRGVNTQDGNASGKGNGRARGRPKKNEVGMAKGQMRLTFGNGQN